LLLGLQCSFSYILCVYMIRKYSLSPHDLVHIYYFIPIRVDANQS